MLKPFEKPVYITQPFLPPIEEFCDGLKEIWDNHWLTNNGPILKRYTRELENYFETDNVCLFNNGTLALQIGLQGMGISGEVITTPFTFVATTHALFWNKIRPVFVDIEPDYYTLDPEKVEAAITPWTTAILAVHVYGHPCNLDALADIASRYNLKLIYDAAHAYGVTVNGRSIAHYGDLSMFSFHATKLYHSIEGGMLTFQDADLKQKYDYLKNFGFKNETEVVMPGTNAKMNEFQALMGEMVLKYMPEIIETRKQIYHIYKEQLHDVPGIKMPPSLPDGMVYNYAYMPIEVDEKEFGLSRDGLYEEMKKYNVFTRRYFYPLINEYACYKSVSITDPLHVSKRVAEQIMTLPIYSNLTNEDVERICQIIKISSCTETKKKSVSCSEKFHESGMKPEAEKPMKKIKAVCWGASGHARSVVNALGSSQDIEIIGYLDNVNPERKGQLFEGKNILGGDEQLDVLKEQGITAYILAYGHCLRRIEVGEMLTRRGCRVLSVIHPKAIVAPDVFVGEGSVILAGAIVDSGCTIGNYTIINNGAIVNHECVIGEGTHVCPGVNIAGRTTIGRGCWVGIGATINDKVKVGDHVFIGAGSVVTKDLSSGYLVYGNPARIIRKMDREF